MKCKNCPALLNESYEYSEYYCAAGVPEDGKMSTDEGCKYSCRQILKRVEVRDKIRDRQYEGLGEWFSLHLDLEEAMVSALKQALEKYPYGVLEVAVKLQGEMFPVQPETMRDIAFRLLDAFDEKKVAVLKTYCEKCRWKNRRQKCACCQRNSAIKDNYEENDAFITTGC